MIGRVEVGQGADWIIASVAAKSVPAGVHDLFVTQAGAKPSRWIGSGSAEARVGRLFMINRRNFLQGTSVLMAHAGFSPVVATFVASRATAAATLRDPTFLSAVDELVVLLSWWTSFSLGTDSPAASAAEYARVYRCGFGCVRLDQTASNIPWRTRGACGRWL